MTNATPSLDVRAFASNKALPGISYFFSEDRDCAYGIQADLAVVECSIEDEESLSKRFFDRLMVEFDRIGPVSATYRDDLGAPQHAAENAEPVSIFWLIDGVVALKIVPTAIARNELQRVLRSEVEIFVTYLSGSICE